MITGKFYYYYDDNPKGYGIRYSPGEWLSIREENENTYSRVCTCENDRVYFHLEIPRDIAVPNLTSGFIVVTGTFRVERGGGSTMPFIKVKSIRRLQQ